MQNFTTEIKKITCTFNLHAAGYQPDRPNHHLRLRFCSLQILPKDLCWLICRQRQFSINSPHKRSKRFIPAASLNLANVFLPQVSSGRNTCMRPFCIAPVPALVERCNSPAASHNLHTLQIVRTTVVLYLTPGTPNNPKAPSSNIFLQPFNIFTTWDFANLNQIYPILPTYVLQNTNILAANRGSQITMTLLTRSHSNQVPQHMYRVCDLKSRIWSEQTNTMVWGKG